MIDAKKSAEALKKIQEIKQKISGHQSKISQIDHEKSTRVKFFDQQIQYEQNEIKKYTKQIDDLKKLI